MCIKSITYIDVSLYMHCLIGASMWAAAAGHRGRESTGYSDQALPHRQIWRPVGSRDHRQTGKEKEMWY